MIGTTRTAKTSHKAIAITERELKSHTFRLSGRPFLPAWSSKSAIVLWTEILRYD